MTEQVPDIQLPPNMTIVYEPETSWGVRAVTISAVWPWTDKSTRIRIGIDTGAPAATQARALVDAAARLWGHELAEYVRVDGEHVVEPHPTPDTSRHIPCVRPI